MFIAKPANQLTREDLISMLRDFINQRPGFDTANYATAQSYRADYRTTVTHRDDAILMLLQVEALPGITADAIRAELERGNRLALTPAHCKEGKIIKTGTTLHYTAGQYWCTEYRAGACRVLSSLLWDYWRESAQPCTGDELRKYARTKFPRGLARRWFT